MNFDQDPHVNVNKDRSPNITTETDFKKIEARISCYNEIGCTPRSPNAYPRVVVAAGDDLIKFQRGVVRITIQDGPSQRARNYFVNMDVMNNVFMKTYGAGHHQ